MQQVDVTLTTSALLALSDNTFYSHLEAMIERRIGRKVYVHKTDCSRVNEHKEIVYRCSYTFRD